MNNLHIENSYHIWNTKKMKAIIEEACQSIYNTANVHSILNRNFTSLYIEWWLHNIAYYLTIPFCFIKKIEVLNKRARHVDLNERIKGDK